MDKGQLPSCVELLEIDDSVLAEPRLRLIASGEDLRIVVLDRGLGGGAESIGLDRGRVETLIRHLTAWVAR